MSRNTPCGVFHLKKSYLFFDIKTNFLLDLTMMYLVYLFSGTGCERKKQNKTEMAFSVNFCEINDKCHRLDSICLKILLPDKCLTNAD